MTRRINNSLPYPYSQFFNETPEPPDLDCSEEKPKQFSSNNNSVFIVLIIILLFFSPNKILAASAAPDADLNSSEIPETNNDNYYE